MASHADQRTGFRYFELIVLMGVLQAFAPLSIDMYLPSMPLLEKVFHATTAEVQTTLVTFLLGYALGRGVHLSDEPLLAEMQKRLAANGYQISVAIQTILESRQFLEIRGRDSQIAESQ